MNRLLEFTTGEHGRSLTVDALKILYVEDVRGEAAYGSHDSTAIIFSDGRGTCATVCEDAETVVGNWAAVLQARG